MNDSYMQEIDKDRLPGHVAIIMDGNGRWARSRGLNRLEGHREGVESVRAIIKASRKIGITHLTLYTFSEENWRRPQAEVEGLMILLNRHLKKEIEELHQNEVRVNAIGDLSQLPQASRNLLKDAMHRTRHNTGLVMSLALSYGGRQEIIHACRALAEKCGRGEIAPADIDQTLFGRHLFTADLPDPDLVIRTGGENRVSNFLLWQIAYSEIYVTQTYWPDFRDEELRLAIIDYQSRQRRFGKTGDQVAAEPHAGPVGS